jgi:Domain of unknown function (DUF1772)
VLLANWPYTIYVVMPTNRLLMDTPPGAATAETRRLIERWGALHAGRSVLGLVASPDLSVGKAMMLLSRSNGFERTRSKDNKNREIPGGPIRQREEIALRLHFAKVSALNFVIQSLGT